MTVDAASYYNNVRHQYIVVGAVDTHTGIVDGQMQYLDDSGSITEGIVHNMQFDYIVGNLFVAYVVGLFLYLNKSYAGFLYPRQRSCH